MNTARFQLNEDDMVNAARLYGRVLMRRPKAIASWIAVFLGCLVLMSMIAGVLFPFDGERLANRWPVILGASLLPFVFLFVLNVFVLPITVRRNFRQQRSLHGEVKMAWTGEHLAIDSEYGSFAIPWSHFVLWGEDAKSFVILESDRLYRPIPKRFLDSDTQQCLREKLALIGS